MSNGTRVMVTLNRDVEEYIGELETAYNFHYRHCPVDSGQIPDAVFERFCGDLRDGTKASIDGDGLPSEVIRRLADEGDYGPVEGYEPEQFLYPLLRAGLALYAGEKGGGRPGREALRLYIRGHREECMERSGLRDDILLWYRDEAGGYGISIALTLGA